MPSTVYSNPDLPGQFAHLADVVQDDAGEQQIAMQHRIVRRDAVSQHQQAHHVLQQSAEPRMVQLLCRGSLAIRLCQRGIAENLGQQQLQIWFSKAVDKSEQLPPQRVNVAGRGGQHVGLIRFTRRGFAQLIDLHLQPVVIARHAAAGLHNVSAIKFLRDARVTRIPDAAFHLACFIAKDQIQIRLVRLRQSLLFMQNEKIAVEDSVFVEACEIRNIDVLHSARKITAKGWFY